MAYTRKALLSLLLILSTLISLAACSAPEVEIVKDEIEITESAPISDASKERARVVILDLIRYGYRAAVMSNISAAKDQELSALADRVLPLTLDKGLSEAQYTHLFDTLATQGEGVISELSDIAKGESSALTSTEALYVAISGEIGADAVGSILYDICLLRYDIRLEKLNTRYEQYGFPYLLEDIASLRADTAVMRESIGREAFAAVIKNAFAIAALIRGDRELLDSLEPGEMLILLAHIELEEMKIGEEGWALLFSFLSPSGNESYEAKIRAALKASGDDIKIAAVMDSAVSFISHVRDKLSADDIAAIRDGRGDDAVSRLFGELNDEELELFFSVTEVDIDRNRYSELAELHYGEDFTAYKRGIKEVSRAELTAAIGADDFSARLTEYIEWRFSALTYEVLK